MRFRKYVAFVCVTVAACKPAWQEAPSPEALRYLGCYRVTTIADTVRPAPEAGARALAVEPTIWQLTATPYPRASNPHRFAAFEAHERRLTGEVFDPTESAAWNSVGDSVHIQSQAYGWQSSIRLWGSADSLAGRIVSTTHLGWYMTGRMTAVREPCGA